MALSNMDVQEIVEEMNKRVAAMLREQPKPVSVAFVPLIKRVESMRDGQVVLEEVKGRCWVNEGKIEIVPCRNWGITLIEELVHLYRPHIRHPQVKELVKQSVRYLKATVGQERLL